MLHFGRASHPAVAPLQVASCADSLARQPAS